MFLNLEIKNFNEKADRFLRTASKSGSIYITGERCFVCAQEKEVGYSAHGPSPLSDPSLCRSLMQTAEFLEGKQVERRRKEKGKEGGKKRGRGMWPFYV